MGEAPLYYFRVLGGGAFLWTRCPCTWQSQGLLGSYGEVVSYNL